MSLIAAEKEKAAGRSFGRSHASIQRWCPRIADGAKPNRFLNRTAKGEGDSYPTPDAMVATDRSVDCNKVIARDMRASVNTALKLVPSAPNLLRDVASLVAICPAAAATVHCLAGVPKRNHSPQLGGC